MSALVVDTALTQIAALLGAAAVAFPVYHHTTADLPAPTRRLAGGLILGLGPALVALALVPGGPAAIGLGAAPVLPTLAALLVLLPLLPVLWSAAGRPVHQARYPEHDATVWDRGVLTTNAASWAFYLLGYELLFRGVLVLGLAASLGPGPALVVSTALYVYAHLHKDLGECLGCVAMGLVFGGLALWTGAIWAPLLLHLAIALTSDLFTVARRDDLSFVSAVRAREGASPSPTSV